MNLLLDADILEGYVYSKYQDKIDANCSIWHYWKVLANAQGLIWNAMSENLKEDKFCSMF